MPAALRRLASLLPPLAVAAGALPAAAVHAAGDRHTVRVTVVVGPATRLTLSARSLTFPNLDPQNAAEVPADENPVRVVAEARAAANARVLLTVQAESDLVDGDQRIGIENVRWSASGEGFEDGVLATVPRLVAAWTGSGSRAGELRYFLANRYEYPTGRYSTTLVHTLSAP